MIENNQNAVKRRRGRQAPSYPLPQTIEWAQLIYHKLREGPFSRLDVAKALGHEKVTGTVTPKIGSLTHFGLLEVAGTGAYRFSTLGIRHIHPCTTEERDDAIAESACSPSLYVEVIERYAGNALPDMLANILIRDFDVLDTSAEDVAAVMRESFNFAGLLQHGILHKTPRNPSNRSKDAEAEQPAESAELASIVSSSPVTESMEKRQKTEDDDTNFETHPIYLGAQRRALLSLPRNLKHADLVKIEAWISYMKTVVPSEE